MREGRGRPAAAKRVCIEQEKTMGGKLEGKVALVTGAGRRVGKAIALALGEAGADVAVHYGTSKEQAEETAEK